MTPRLARFTPLLLALATAPIGALAMLVASRTDPLLPLAAVVGLGAVVWAWRRPLDTLLLALVLIPLDSVTLPLGPGSASPAEALFVLSAFCGTAARLVASRPVWPRGAPLARPLLLLWVSVLPGLVVAEQPFPVLRLAVFWGAFLLLFALVATEADDAYVRRFLLVVAVLGGVLGLTALLSSGGSAPELSSTGETATGRAGGVFNDPNILGTMLALALPAAIYTGLDGRWRSPFALGACLPILVGLGLTLSRGAILAAAGAMLVLLAWKRVQRVAAAGLVLLVILVAVGVNPLGGKEADTVIQRIGSVKVASSSAPNERIAVYRNTPKLIEDHWLVGVGALNYSIVAPRYGIVEAGTGFTFDHAHNLVLTIGAEQGLIGLLALAGILIAMLKTAPRIAGRRVGARRGAGLAVIAGVAALALQGFVDFTFRSNIVAAFAFLLFGVIAALDRLGRGPEPTGAAAPPARTS